MRQIVTFLATLSLLLCAAPIAMAQSGPFAPLPPAQPQATPTPTPVGSTESGNASRATLFLIGGGVLLAFFAIGWWISRDARRNLTDDDRRALERAEHHTDPTDRRRQKDRVKQRARQRTKAQKAARRHNRPR
jgi:hypothetical protein